MPEEVNQQPTESAFDYPDIDDAIATGEGAGDEESTQQNNNEAQGGEGSQEAQSGEGKAPQDGTTEQKPEAEQPIALKGNAPAEVHKWFQDKGWWNEEKGLDFANLHKSYSELEKGFHERNKAIASYQTQVNSLRVGEERKEPLTREQVVQTYRESKDELSKTVKAINALYSAIPQDARGAVAEVAQQMDQWLREEERKLEEQRDSQIEEVRKAEYAKEFGITLKTGQPLDDPETARNKANQNALQHFSQEEQKPEYIAKVLGGQNVQTLLHVLAAAKFPREYNKGESDEEIQNNNIIAINRVLAHSPELAGSLVNLGKNAVRAEAFEAEKGQHGEAEYKRGYEDGAKGRANRGIPSASKPVKPVTQPGSSSVEDSIMAQQSDWN